MLDYSKTDLALPNFISSGKVEETLESVGYNTNTRVQTMYGKLEEEAPVCSCGCKMHIRETRTIVLKHIGFHGLRIDVAVSYNLYRCPHCKRNARNPIPFKAEGHNATKFFIRDLIGLLRFGVTIKDASKIKSVCKNIVRKVDKEWLKGMYKDMLPEKPPRFIGIDEFSLHDNHRYATVVGDLENGHVIFLAEGNTQQQATDFILRMGNKIMRGIKAVAMDMNAQFHKAFETLCPWIKIVYDPFHIIKNYNDRVLTAIRRDEQNRLEDEWEKALRAKDYKKARELEEARKLLKHSNYLILANRSTLEARTEAARAHNKYLYETYEKHGLEIPKGERKWRITGPQDLKNILASNERIQAAYVFREMLQAALKCTEPQEMKKSLDMYLEAIKASKIPELEGIYRMLNSHIEGIISHAVFPISNGVIEGTNNMIKTLKKQAYGFRDTEYFFLKIWDASRRHPKNRDYLNPQKSA